VSTPKSALPQQPSALYQLADRLVFKPLGPDLAHKLVLLALASRFSLRTQQVSDAWRWREITFPNRVGIAAGFDKNAFALTGMAEIGAGFAEVGTILTRPWPGSLLRPRMARLEPERALWNRLGFPSIGVRRVADRLSRFRRTDIQLGCNIAPHPLTLRVAGEPGFAARVRAELLELVRWLHPWTKFVVINLSSPNTPGLRGVLYGEGFAQEIVAPLREHLRELSHRRGQSPATPLLVKLPPEGADREPWTPASLRPLVQPLAHADVCDGFVAVNSSSGLALAKSPHARADAPGGVSGAPLLPLALRGMRALCELALPSQLRIGVGGISKPEDAVAMIEAGANLVEIYSGMVYQGPMLLGQCADAIREYAELVEYGLPPRADRPFLRNPSPGIKAQDDLTKRIRPRRPE
jgi:dihydroorotate dehydrogenase